MKKEELDVKSKPLTLLSSRTITRTQKKIEVEAS